MRLDDFRKSDNVEDRRGGIPGGAPVALGGGGLLIVLLISWLLGVNPMTLLQSVDSGSCTQIATAPVAGGSPADLSKGDTFSANPL